MNLFILCIAMILAENWAVANPCNCDSQNCNSQNCDSQNCDSQNNCNNCGDNCCDTGASILDDNQRTIVAFNQYEIISDDFLCEPPGALARVSFYTAAANLGNCISPWETGLPPYVTLETANPLSNYTIITCDIDVPSPASPDLRSFFVGMCNNINGSDLAAGTQKCGDDVVPWVGPLPCPGSGPHRVVILIFKQSRYIDPCDRRLVKSSAIRIRFNLVEFQSNFSLNLVAGNFWTSCLPDDYCTVCDRNKPYRLYRNDGYCPVLNNDNMYISA